MLYEGLNLSELGRAFKMDHRVLVEKLHNVPPSGTRSGHDTWTIAEAAPHLVKPIYDIEEYIKRMHHHELPKMVTKEFWNGLRARQEYEQREGNLWPTARVVEVMGGIMKLIKMSARLMTDAVDRQAELSDRQRGLIKTMTDGFLEEAHRTILEKFSKAPSNPEVIEKSQLMIAEVEAYKPEDDDEL